MGVAKNKARLKVDVFIFGRRKFHMPWKIEEKNQAATELHEAAFCLTDFVTISTSDSALLVTVECALA